ncbi:hypothetical protein O181_020900 [Austropuccinia psidii MF-1]|uniref:Integrase catalytic domain-containing protein n=1 Tax=Austropuccinia psidii MF-1 TaxID=1389203 RepID=A0A9Q3CEN4_9BASI|nr:hypothetical protein [Austropuccinia psidii MF-1]
MTNNISEKEYSFIPILDASNFSKWNGRMTILLKSKELMESLNVSRCNQKSKRTMLELEAVNLIVQPEILTFTLLVLSKLQDYCDNSRSQIEIPSSHSSSSLVSESVHPYRIMHYCANGKHNPNCTTHSKEESFAKNPHLRPHRANKKRTNNNQDASAHLSTAQALVTGPTSHQEELIIDCGATHHMFNSESFFSSINKTPPMKVSTGDSESSLRAKGVGTVTISCNNNFITLRNCLFVPNLNCNLISLLELFKGKLTINRINDQFTLESNNNIKISGKIQNNLMKMEYQIPKSFATSKPLDCVHLDLVGPIHPASNSGFQYFLTIVDQATSFKITCLLKQKSEAYDQFIIVKRMMENLHDHSIKKLVLDRGGELLNEKFKKLSEEQGFTHFFSPPETPKHNGFAERANQTILEKAWCMLSTSNLPSCYWAEAVNTATLLSNFTPTPSRMNNCLFALWKNTGPQVKKTRIFGCREIVSIPKSHQEWKQRDNARI